MTEILNINNQVAKIAKEHNLITNYIVEFKNRLKTRDKAFFKGLASFFNFLEKDLLVHFRFEEVVIFPAAIVGESTYDNILMVMSLEKEHGMLENQMQLLLTEIKALHQSHEKLTIDLIERISVFFDDLKIHAKREMTDLFPRIDANPKSKALLKNYVKEMTHI